MPTRFLQLLSIAVIVCCSSDGQRQVGQADGLATSDDGSTSLPDTNESGPETVSSADTGSDAGPHDDADGLPEATLQFELGVQQLMVAHDNNGAVTERAVALVAPFDFSADANYPIFFLFHGSGGGAQSLVAQCNDAIKAGHAILCVVPTGEPQVSGNGPGWNLGAGQTEHDDRAFIHAVWGMLDDEPYIDHTRVFALGNSMGSAFAGNVLAIDPDSPFTGLVQSASQLWTTTTPTRPMRVLILHGEDDKLIPIDGGVAFQGFEFVSVNESLARWAELAGCPAGVGPVENDTADYTRVVYEGCSQPLVLYRLNGLGHNANIKNWFPDGPVALAAQIFLDGSAP